MARWRDARPSGHRSDCGAFIDRDGVHTTEAGAIAIARAVSRVLLACPPPSRDTDANMGNGAGAGRCARQRRLHNLHEREQGRQLGSSAYHENE